MTITLFGAVLIPVALAVALLWPWYLMPLLIVTAVFPAASVLNLALGRFAVGVQPYYFVAVLVAAQACMSAIRTSRWLPRPSSPLGPASRTMVKYWLWATASAFVLPVLFRGLPVLVPRAGIPDLLSSLASGSYASPLRWSFSNLAQALYLTLNVVVVLYAARPRQGSEAKRTLRALRWSVWIVAGVGLWQFAAHSLGWGFPYSFFNSNPVYAQLYTQTLGSFRRVNSTFTEPSYAGGFLAAVWLGLMAEFLRGRRSKSLYLGMGCVAVALVLTTASTGYLAAVLGSLLLFFFLGPLQPARLRRIPVKRLLTAGGIIAVSAGIALIAVHGLLHAASLVTIDKLHSASFADRIVADLFSLRIFVFTYGLGTGLGSNRPSSLLTYLLSDVGIIGFALLFLFVVKLLSLLASAARKQKGTEFTFILWALIGWLLAQVLALSDPNYPVLWALIAVAVGLLSVGRIGDKAGGFAAMAKAPSPAPATALHRRALATAQQMGGRQALTRQIADVLQ